MEETDAGAGNIVVWRGKEPGETPHSAVLSAVLIAKRGTRLDYRTQIRTKNGMMPEVDASLEELVERFGESYGVFRRSQVHG